jgi:hypothetical protein
MNNNKRHWGEMTARPDDGGCYICSRYVVNDHGGHCQVNEIVAYDAA